MALGRDPKHDVLFEPVRIGPKTLRNRFYQVPHCTGFGVERPAAQARFRATKAEGGWAAVCTEFCSIHPDSDAVPHPAARLWDEDDVRALALFCEEVHASSSLAGVELWHGGPTVLGWDSRMVPGGPTQLPVHLPPHACVVPRALDRDDIREIQSWYVDAAERARRAAFDIVYVYGAFSYLPMQFLSPFFNQRTDEYGGSLENRARFWLECLEQVRSAVGDDCAIAGRISVDALGPGGVELDEALAFIELADHLVDLWDVTIGSSFNWAEMAPSRFTPEYFMGEWTRHVKAHTSKPVVGCGRLVSPDLMAEIVKRGELDLIGAARPSIADPFLPKKIEEGRLDDIRECIGCNVCLQRAVWGPQIACTQNATAGEEYRRGWHPERFPRAGNADRDVLVIGAGAAGMECARVLGERGMRRVHLVDARGEMGGYAAIVASLPGLGDWRRVVDYRKIQIDKLRNVEFIPRTRLSADDVLQYGAEIVVVAAGAYWAPDGLNHVTRSPIPGASLEHVLRPEDMLVRGAEAGATVLVYDCEGHVMGAGMAELIAMTGRRVVLATPLAEVAPYTNPTVDGFRIRTHLAGCGIDLLPGTQLVRIDRDTCSLETAGETAAIDVDTIVLATARISNDSLYRTLKGSPGRRADAGIHAVYAIGDCVAPRLIADCVFDGHRLAREIDSPDPRWPLPFIRERRLPGAVNDDDYERTLACSPPDQA